MYKVVNNFRDLKNDNHIYLVGDEYPVAGYKPTKARIEELSTEKNKFGKVFIKEVKEENSSADEKSTETEENKTEE